MSVVIKAYKVIRYVDTYDDTDDRYVATIYCLNGFEPIKHITQFEQDKLAELEWAGSTYISCPCSTFNQFRGIITEYFYNMDYYKFCDNITVENLKEPFKEMLWFADNEGCFDYAIAEKLVKDFEQYKDEILKDHKAYSNIYNSYLNILKECVAVKGIVEYY